MRDGPTQPGPRRRLSMSAWTLIGVAAGVVLGLTIGEYASFLQVVADGYIKLLQMTVLPYVTVSIVGGLGALNGADVRRLGVRVGLVLALLWGLALVAVCLFPLMFPSSQNASFFSTAALQEREPFDFLGLYIPSNPFNSLANNIVPAVVLFSVFVGVALTAIPEKARLLDVLAVVRRAVARATDFIVALTPIGVFAIAAVVAGTLSIDDLQRLEVYLITYAGVSLLLAFWILPGLVATLTPVPYRELVGRMRGLMVTAFMTTSLFAVLPLITEEAKALIAAHGGGDTEQTDIIVPASFNFPHAGKLLSLSFLLFAGWFVDARVPVTQYPRLAVAGLFAMFGNVNASVPFLLDLFRLPADTFRLFVTSGVLNARFGTLVAASHTAAVAIIGTCAVTGLLRVDRRRLTRFVVGSAIATAALVGGTRVLLAYAVGHTYTKDVEVTRMTALRDRGPASVYAHPEHAPALAPVTTTVLDRVRARQALRVAYIADSLPYAFFNGAGELVGFDIEMAHQLARDLGVSLELVPMARSQLDAAVDPSLCDIVMSGVVVTTDRSGRILYSSSYLDETVAFIVPDYRLRDFSEWSSVRAMGPVRIGIPPSPYYAQKIRDELNEAVIVPISSLDAMFEPGAPAVDAIIATAERGSVYTLLHPEYSVAVPRPRPFKVPLAYVIAGHDAAMASLVDTWIDLKRKDGTIDALFAHWILGEDSRPKQPRWSVIRDVLHWVR